MDPTPAPELLTRRAPLRVEAPSSFEALRAGWQRLAYATGSVFATWEWASAWWALYGRPGRLALLPVRQGDALVGILPLYTQDRLGLRFARLVGHEGGDELGPICAPIHRPAMLAAVPAALRRPELCADLLIAEALPAVDWERALGGTILRRSSNPTAILVARDWEEFLRGVTRKLRREITHGERRLRREHRVVYRVTDDPARLPEDLDTFFRLHAARWPVGSSLLAREPFYRRFAASALERGWLRLAILELDGTPAAARLDFRFANVHFAYNAGRDPRWQKFSLGLLLRSMTLRDALEDGVREYRLLRGGESYKYRLASSDRGSLMVAIPATLMGRAAITSASALAWHRSGRQLLSGAIDRFGAAADSSPGATRAEPDAHRTDAA